MQNSRNILANTIIYFVGCLISIAALILFTQITGLNIFNQSSIPGFIKYASLPLIISIFIGYAITIATYQSQKKYAVMSTFLVIIILSIAFGIYYSTICQELGCIYVGLFALAAFVILIPFSASIPVFFEELPIPVSLIFVVIITIVITGAISFKAILGVNAQKAEVKKEQAILKNNQIPKYDLNYGSFSAKTLITEGTSDNRNSNKPNLSAAGEFRWLNDEGSFIYYSRYYQTQDKKFFLSIIERKPGKSFTDNDLFNNDLAELKTVQQNYNTGNARFKMQMNLQELKINGYPAIMIIYPSESPKLRIYREGLIIELEPTLSGIQNNFTSEEMEKMGQSLYLAQP